MSRQACLARHLLFHSPCLILTPNPQFIITFRLLTINSLLTVDYRLLPSLLPTSLQKKIIKFYRGVKFFYIFAARMEKYLSYNMFDNCAGPLVGTAITAITPPIRYSCPI